MAQKQAVKQQIKNSEDLTAQARTSEEIFMENEINLRRAQQAKKEQAKQEFKKSSKDLGKKMGGMAGARIAGPIGGLAGRIVGGAAASKTAKNINEKLEKSGQLDEIAQAGIINSSRNTSNVQQKSDLMEGMKEISKEEIKKQVKKKLAIMLLGTAPAILFFTTILLALGLILFCIVSVYNCTQKKGLIGSAWTTYRTGFTGLLKESFSGTCLSEGVVQDDSRPARNEEQSNNEGNNGNQSDIKTETTQ